MQKENRSRNFGRKSSGGPPALFLAPMEKLGDRCLRRVVAKIGGVDECCTEFLRVPSVPPEPRLRYLEGISKQHDPSELAEYGVPLAVQVGSYSLF